MEMVSFTIDTIDYVNGFGLWFYNTVMAVLKMVCSANVSKIRVLVFIVNVNSE